MFQLALRLEHRDSADVGNRADALHGMALAASHAGCTPTTFMLLFVQFHVIWYQAMAPLAAAT